MKTRCAIPSDAERIAGYHHECWVVAYRPILPGAVVDAAQPQRQLWDHWLAPDSDFVTVVLVDDADRPQGHTTVNGNQLVHLFIAPEHHRKGLGRRMLKIGEDLIRQAGHSQAELHTRVGNEPALGLYQSSGWWLTDEFVDDPQPDGSLYPEHVLRKDF